MGHSLLFLLTVIFVACVLTTPSMSNPTSKKQGGGLVLNLIHRDLIYPRSNLSKPISINQTSYQEKQRGKLLPRTVMFYIIFYIGSQRVRQFASLDTGSSFLWVQCAGYTSGHRTLNDVYNHTKSSSYVPSSCLPPADNQYCGRVSGHGCDAHNRCKYELEFLDGSHSNGYIGFETISFLKYDRTNQTTVRNVLFGCGTENYNTNRFEDGVFGIGGILELSIAGHNGRRFSICTCNINDVSYKYNHLALGNDARLVGVAVPFHLLAYGGYGVALNTIRIGSSVIHLPSNFMVVIDSGSTTSRFLRFIYNEIRSEVENIIGTHMLKKNSTAYPNDLCYDANNIWRAFPGVTMESGGLRLLTIDIGGIFWRPQGENVICLAIQPVDNAHFNLIGAVQMQYHNVGFDLNTMKAYFKRISDCKW